MDGGHATSMAEVELRDNYVKAAQVSTPKSEAALAFRLAVAVKLHLRNKFNALFQASLDKPMLYSYQADDSSHRVGVRYASASSGVHVQRRGEALVEFLQERAYLKVAQPGGGFEHRLLLQPPDPSPLERVLGICSLHSQNSSHSSRRSTTVLLQRPM